MARRLPIVYFFSSWSVSHCINQGKIGQQSVPLIHCSVPNFIVIDAEVLVYDF